MKTGRLLAAVLAGLGMVTVLSGFTLPGQVERLWRQADRAYARKDYATARQRYEQAQQLRPQEWLLRYNAAVAAGMAKDYDQAVAGLQAVAQDGPASLRQAAEYNLGNCYLAQQKADEAIAHYKRALYLKPDDLDAKWNLELAKRQQQKQQQQQQQQKPRPQPQDQKKQPQKQQPKPQNNPQQRPASAPRSMDREEARRLLQSLSQQDRDLQRQLRKAPRRPSGETRPEKDW